MITSLDSSVWLALFITYFDAAAAVCCCRFFLCCVCFDIQALICSLTRTQRFFCLTFQMLLHLSHTYVASENMHKRTHTRNVYTRLQFSYRWRCRILFSVSLFMFVWSESCTHTFKWKYRIRTGPQRKHLENGWCIEHHQKVLPDVLYLCSLSAYFAA